MKIEKEILKIAKYIVSSERVGYRYQDIGHGAGSIIWWVDNSGKVKTHVSTGTEMHHELNRKMDMDMRWRGRIEDKSGTTTLLPPLKIYSLDPDDIVVPNDLMRQLRRLGAKSFILDSAYGGMRRVVLRKAK